MGSASRPVSTAGRPPVPPSHQIVNTTTWQDRHAPTRRRTMPVTAFGSWTLHPITPSGRVRAAGYVESGVTLVAFCSRSVFSSILHQILGDTGRLSIETKP